MRVTTAAIFGNIQKNLQDLAGELQRVNASIASGQKYQNISDNPVEVGALLGLNREARQSSQFERNLEPAQEWLRVTEATLSTINDLVTASAAVATQMATGTYNAAQRQAAAEQIQGYLEEVMQTGNTKINGHYILSGYRTDTAPFAPQDFAIQEPVVYLKAGSTGAVTSGGTYTGSSSRTYVVEIVNGGGAGVGTYKVSSDGGQTWSSPQTIPAGAVNLGDGVQATLSGVWESGDRFSIAVYRPIAYQGDTHDLEMAIAPDSTMVVNTIGSTAVGGDGEPDDLFQILARLKSGLEANDLKVIGDSLAALRVYQNQLNSIVAGLGAAQERITVKQETYATLTSQLEKEISTRGDTDVVEAVNLLSTKEAAYQAALLASSKVMNLSLMDYL
jgi:flagellin-like hook-associated protein FlgL